MLKSKGVFALIAGILCVTLIALVVVRSTIGSRPRDGTGGTGVNSLRHEVDPGELDRVEFLSRIESAALERLTSRYVGGGSLPEEAGLVRAYGSAMERYLLGGVEEFLSHVRETEEVTPENEEFFRRQWEAGSKAVSMLPIDDAGIFMRQARIGGYAAEPVAYGNERAEFTRVGAGGVGDPREAGLDVVEIVTPMMIRSYGGKPEGGYFGLSFAYDPVQGRWVLIGLSVSREQHGGEPLVVPPV